MPPIFGEMPDAWLMQVAEWLRSRALCRKEPDAPLWFRAEQKKETPDGLEKSMIAKLIVEELIVRGLIIGESMTSEFIVGDLTVRDLLAGE